MLGTVIMSWIEEDIYITATLGVIDNENLHIDIKHPSSPYKLLTCHQERKPTSIPTK